MPGETVSILGCGWLGLPLAENLKKKGYDLKGSTRDAEKLSLLESKGIKPFLINCEPRPSVSQNPNSQVPETALEDFFAADVLILTLPFRRDLADPEFYYKQIAACAQMAAGAGVSFVIFTGSTSVYPDSPEEASEDKTFVPGNRRAEVLRDTERMLLDHPDFDATVLRLAGLYGGERRIGRFLAESRNISRPNSPVNLIHLEDCVGIITEIVRQNVRGEIFNACADKHPLRKDLYTRAAERIGLTPPEFTSPEPVPGKIVTNRKVKERLRYQFQHPDPASE